MAGWQLLLPGFRGPHGSNRAAITFCSQFLPLWKPALHVSSLYTCSDSEPRFCNAQENSDREEGDRKVIKLVLNMWYYILKVFPTWWWPSFVHRKWCQRVPSSFSPLCKSQWIMDVNNQLHQSGNNTGGAWGQDVDVNTIFCLFCFMTILYIMTKYKVF